MNAQLDTTRNRVRALAVISRGTRSREEMLEGSGISLSTYTDFETGKRWPRSVTLRRIEKQLGWNNGVIDEFITSGMEPALVGLEHMRGEAAFTSPAAGLRGYTEAELFQELARRSAERAEASEQTSRMFAEIEKGDLDLAASRDLGEGIQKGDLPDA